MDGNIVDTTDFAILFAVKQHDMPPWKNKIHGWIVDHQEMLPGIDGVSVQTVGRRVDRLAKDDLLETVIVSPDDIKRDLIIAFKLTQKGEEAIETTRERLLAEAVEHRLFPERSDGPVEGHSKAVATLLADKLGKEETRGETGLIDQYSQDELATFLTLMYVEQQSDDLLDKKFDRALQKLLQQSDDVSTPSGTAPPQEQ